MHWCILLSKLIEAYHNIKAKHAAFEVIFISSDGDEPYFKEFFLRMPWLALPFGDERKASLSKLFKVRGIPTVVALGPSGKTVSPDCRHRIMEHGANAYPFTDERIKEIEAEIEEIAKGWPEKVKHALHEKHELVRSRRVKFVCDACEEPGTRWSFYCDECDFDLHPKCALDGAKDGDDSEDVSAEDSKKEWVCDGEVCSKA